jgi:hypothetical protein
LWRAESWLNHAEDPPRPAMVLVACRAQARADHASSGEHMGSVREIEERVDESLKMFENNVYNTVGVRIALDPFTHGSSGEGRSQR